MSDEAAFFTASAAVLIALFAMMAFYDHERGVTQRACIAAHGSVTPTGCEAAK